MNHYYFDHNATTPVAEQVLEVYGALLKQVYGNASSIHSLGQEAKRRLAAARRQVAWMVGGAPEEIVFTAGGTEADNLALLGVLRACRRPHRHLITTAIEHPAVLNTCAQLAREGVEVTYLPVDGRGVVEPDAVRRALRPETVLISVMHANNEIGTLQPVAEIGAIAREAGVLFHSDGVQAAGKLPLHTAPPPADLYSLSAHKFYAPKGIGALYVRQGVELAPVLHGGHQERDRRPGTENVPGAAAMGAAARWVRGHVAREAARLGRLRDRLEQAVLERIPGTGVNGSGPRVANTTNIHFDGVSAEALLIALDLRGFAVSSGSACSSGSVEPSHVLRTLGLSPEQARSSLRLSLGLSNTTDQVDALVDALVEVVAHLRKLSPAGVSRV